MFRFKTNKLDDINYNNLRFNTSYVSVQVAGALLTGLAGLVSIHPMFRFKICKDTNQNALKNVSIHPMFRFKIYSTKI